MKRVYPFKIFRRYYHSNVIEHYENPKNVGSLNKDEKENVLNKFTRKTIDILVSTTVIEVGIDFPNANVMVIENSNKFGLSQLHQLRGRVGRGINQGICILLYNKNLSVNAKERIRILKSSNDGFFIAEKDMKLRGFGDVLGYQQNGLKDFKSKSLPLLGGIEQIGEASIQTIVTLVFIINNFDRIPELNTFLGLPFPTSIISLLFSVVSLSVGLYRSCKIITTKCKSAH